MAQNPVINSEISEISEISGIPYKILSNPTNFSSICELPNNKFIATSNNFIYEFDLTTQEKKDYSNYGLISGHTSTITCCCLLGNNKFLITGSSDNTIRAWNINKRRCEYILDGHTDTVTCIVPHKKGQIISGSVDRRIKIWDVASRQCLKILDGEDMIGSICVTENYILGGNSNGVIIIWDKITYAQQGRLTTNNGISSIIQLDESHIICAGGNIITIWNIDTRNCEQELKGHTGVVSDLSLLQDGSGRLASISGGNIRIWDLNTYEIEDILTYPSSLGSKIEALENGWIASIHNNIIRFWNPEEFPIPPEPIFNENGESLDEDGSILPNCAVCWNVINPNRTFSILECGGMFHNKCIKYMINCAICDKTIV